MVHRIRRILIVKNIRQHFIPYFYFLEGVGYLHILQKIILKRKSTHSGTSHVRGPQNTGISGFKNAYRRYVIASTIARALFNF